MRAMVSRCAKDREQSEAVADDAKSGRYNPNSAVERRGKQGERPEREAREREAGERAPDMTESTGSLL